ncbi:MAG: transposase [Candidatus Omnitrophota bacterium]|nr:transposase [Candidatus Omnitrophota bacterium]
MPRISRLLPETGVFHILTRGNNRQKTFEDQKDYKYYLYLLKFYKEEHRFRLYHYCLMPNHVHLILETTPETNLSKLMKQINLAYMYHFRKRYHYWGHFWQGRFKSLLIDKDEYLITCGRYVESNPVRAKMVQNPGDYPWSSYRVYAQGAVDGLVDIDPLYEDLSKSPKERQKIYRDSIEQTQRINFNLRFLGSRSFINRMEEQFGVKNLRNRRGRPFKVNK